MAKNDKRISIAAFDKVAKEQAVSDAVFDWHGVELVVKYTLGLTDMMEFVHDAAESCFSESGAFVPEVMDFAIKSNILSRYARFSLPDNLEHRYALIYETDAVDVVCEHINERQLQEITASIKRRVNYVCESKITLIQQKAEEMFAAFERLREQSESMFDNVSKDDIQKLLGAVANGSFDEEAIVKAYLKQTKLSNEQKDAEGK
ncbi:MAG: hypothetical protein NC548_35760 [Lachnospiraceae bacterium]|nr:hypothetical protein [Lachnospiraceae bacterium]MCM1233141.1 hypothetical protein [Ruminococcus flavefaciens]